MEDDESIPDFIGLPFYQQRRVIPKPMTLTSPSRKRKRSRDNQENLTQCIRESLGESEVTTEISFGGTVVPLPGFDDTLSCKLCGLKTMASAFNARATGEGATIGEFLNIAHNRFDQEEGRPSMDVASEIKESLLQYGEQCNIPILKDITNDDVFRHFKYDHTRKSKPRMKDKMLRTLISMLDVSILTCCEKSESGKVVINKSDASLTLNIIDRIHKIAMLKELD